MKRRLAFFCLLMACLSLPGLSQEPQRVAKKGQRIQRDGFLLEWNERQSLRWPGRDDLAWDAIRTGDGLSGYFKYPRRDSCSQWAFQFFPNPAEPTLHLDVKYHPGSAEGVMYNQAIERQGGIEVVIVEWVVAWSQLSADSGGEVSLKIAGSSGCRDTLVPLVLRGTSLEAVSERREPLRPLLLLQLLAAVILLAVYLNLRSRARRFRR